MHFRLKAFSLHLLSSATLLTLILGSLYFGWYRWPGWYLTDVKTVVLVMVCVDVVLGPTLTLIIANQKKSRRELTRDIGIIVAVQLCALTYGSVSLWSGRPLYYAFSENVLQLVQAYDIDAKEAELGREQNPALAPHWYSLPRWIWAPLPQDAEEAKTIMTAVNHRWRRCHFDAEILQALGRRITLASQATKESGRRWVFCAEREKNSKGKNEGGEFICRSVEHHAAYR